MSALGKKYKMKSAKYRIQNTKTKYKLQKKNRNTKYNHLYEMRALGLHALISKTQKNKMQYTKMWSKHKTTKNEMRSTKYKKVENTIMCEKWALLVSIDFHGALRNDSIARVFQG